MPRMSEAEFRRRLAKGEIVPVDPADVIVTEATGAPKGGAAKNKGKRQLYNGHWFSSGEELHRYKVLEVYEEAGYITDLEPHPKFEVQPGFKTVHGQTVRAITYTADFAYENMDGVTVVEDVKGVKFEKGKPKPRIDPATKIRMKMFVRQYVNEALIFNVVDQHGNIMKW